MIKKLLFILLLLPVAIFSQSGSLSHSYIDAMPTGGFMVGDTITVKVEYIVPAGATMTPDFIHYDIEWNNKLLQFVSKEFDPSTSFPANTQNSWSQWTGYQFKPLTSFDGDTYEVSDLDFQFTKGWRDRTSVSGDTDSYPSEADWSVARQISQAASTLPASTPLAYIKFKIKDRGVTSYENYNNITKLNFVRAEDIGDNSGIYDINAGDQYVSLSSVNGVNAGTVTINLKSSETALTKATDYTYTISQSTTDGDGNVTTNEIETGNFDSNGQILSTNLIIDETYDINIEVDNNADWLDDVLTVTDVYLIFQEAIGAGNTPGGTAGAFEYQVQYEIGEITNSGNVDFKDSYEGLSFLAGNDTGTWFTSKTNGAIDYEGVTSEFGVPSNDWYFGFKNQFTVAEDGVINIGHALKGDPDFSHSYTPTATGATTGNSAPVARLSLTAKAMEAPIEANLDIVSELIEGKVHVSINLEEEDVVGNQFDITYDSTVLQLDDVIFDSGNEMTNFSKHEVSLAKVFIGSLDQTGGTTIKTGVPYKLIFTPTETISNTVGLVAFRFTEGVKKDGTKVKYIIK
jgi:hypothetical protein